MNRLFLICTFLFGLFLTKSEGQNFQKADSLSGLRQYALAALEYERIIFENTEFSDSTVSLISIQNIKNEALIRKVFCQKALGNFWEASQTTKRFDFNNLTDSVQFRFRSENILCCYLSKQFEETYSQIQQTKYLIKDAKITNDIDFLAILSLTELGRYREAKELYRQYVANYKLEDNSAQVFSFADNPKFRKVQKAKALATFMPGTGMIYAGNIREGITSLTLQLIALGYGIYGFSEGYYLSGFLTGFGLFQAFYFGGIRRTEMLVEKKNKSLKQRYSKQVKEFLLKLESQRQ
jgi:tetratricopeptide (TPR) repeat protein